MATIKDKRFPILFLIIALVLTLGIFLIDFLKVSITGHAVASGGVGTPFAFALPWILLVVFALVVGVFALKHVK